MEEEGTDRVSSIGLPGLQMQLIRSLHAVGKPLVVVTIHGGPVSEPFLATAPRLAWVWSSYFGQDGRSGLFTSTMPLSYPRPHACCAGHPPLASLAQPPSRC